MEMIKKPFLHSIIVASLLATSFTGCSDDDDDDSDTSTPAVEQPSGNSEETLSGAITSNKTLSASTVYKIEGLVTVKNGATLTIPAGTTLYGNSNGYIVVAKNSKIMAEGTSSNPIIFTSEAAYNGDPEAQGQWGGVVVLGNAPTNEVDAYFEVDSSNPDFAFGGTDSADNSGVLKHIKILNSGYAVAQDKEVNGLSFAGVGTGTVVENIYVKNSKDDGIELWGGTVNLTDIEVINAGDDSFDIDSGYSGTVTNLRIEQIDPAKAGIEASSGGENPMTTATFDGLEIITVSGSSEGGIYIKDDTTAPTFKNVTIDHNGEDGAVRVRRALVSGAKSAINFTNVNITGTVQTITGEGANDIASQLPTLQVVAE